jgi:hypothetical protein
MITSISIEPGLAVGKPRRSWSRATLAVMAKKRKSRKTRRQRSASSSKPASQIKATTAAPDEQAVTAPNVQAKPLPDSQSVAASSAAKAAEASRWSYVGYDVRRIGILITLCVAIELLLWLFFENTPLGPAVYGLVRL